MLKITSAAPPISFIAGPKSGFITSEAKLAFTKLRQTFTEAPMLYHFDLKCHIWIKTDALNYTIDGILSSLASYSS